MKYRKKPVIIDAIQYTGQSIEDIKSELYLNSNSRNIILKDDNILIETLEGTMKANVNDYIIKGINGEIYPCKPDIFEKTYESL